MPRIYVGYYIYIHNFKIQQTSYLCCVKERQSPSSFVLCHRVSCDSWTSSRSVYKDSSVAQPAPSSFAQQESISPPDYEGYAGLLTSIPLHHDLSSHIFLIYLNVETVKGNCQVLGISSQEYLLALGFTVEISFKMLFYLLQRISSSSSILAAPLHALLFVSTLLKMGHFKLNLTFQM